MSAATVSLYRASDFDAVRGLTTLTETHVDLAAELVKSYARVTVARQADATPRAYALTWSIADEHQLIELATHPDARRQGLARALLLESLDFARQGGCRCCLLEVRESNTAALALYRELGFQLSRTRRNYYANGETAVEMELPFA